MARWSLQIALCALFCCVAAGAQTAPHEYKYLFRGKVQDAGGRAVSGVTVNYWRVLETPDFTHYTTSTGAATSTDANGEFAFFGPINPDEKLRFLEFNHDRYGIHLAPVESARAIFCPWNTNLSDVPPLPPERTPTITLPDRAVVRGTVLDAGGQPVAGVEVTPLLALQPPEGDKRWLEAKPIVVVDLSPIFKSTTASDGSFVLPDMPPNVRFGLRAWHPDVGIAFEGEALRTSVDSPLLLTAADTPITITMPEPAAMAGKVVYAPDSIVPAGATIRATHISNGKTASRVLQVDSAGNYHCDALAAGAYRLQLFSGTSRAPEPYITLKPGERHDIPSLSAGPSARLSARVVDANTGKPFRNAKLEWTVVHMEEGVTKTEIETVTGTFHYAERPGMVTIHARGLNFTALDDSNEFQLLLDHGVEISTLEIRATPFRTVSGQVLRQEGTPAPGTKVHASPNNMVIADADGRFSLNVIAKSHGQSLLLGALSEGTPPQVGLVELPKESGDLDGIEIKLTEPCALTGEVVDENYQPFPGMPVSCSNGPLPNLYAFGDDQGRFRLYPVVPMTMVFVNAFGAHNEMMRPMDPGQSKPVGLVKIR